MSDSIERDRDTFATSRTKIQDASPKSRKESKNAYAKSQLLSTSHERQLHEMFKDIDKNQSGRIEEKELKDALRRLGLPGTDRYMKALMEQFDVDVDNSIDFSEFKAYALRTQDTVAKCFAQLDIDASGSISVEDLESALKANWLPLDHDDAARMITLLDADHNGLVSFEEFRSFAFLLPESQVNTTSILHSWVDSADWMDGIEYNLEVSSTPSSGFSRFVAGGVAGGVSKSVVAPFERLKIIMMVDAANKKSFTQTAIKMFKEGGFAGLFRSNLMSVLKVVPHSAIQYGVYETIIDQARRRLTGAGAATELSAVHHITAGAVAGACATLITFPLETVRTQMCVCTKKGMWPIATEIGSASGLRGYYRGYKSAIANAMISSALGFAVYQKVLSQYKKVSGSRQASPAVKGVCAGISACGVMAVVMPLENVQRRLQVQGRDGFPLLYSGSRDCAKRMFQAEGIASFWRGSLSSLLKVAPSLAAVRFSYEWVMHSPIAGGTNQYRDVR